MPKLFKRFVAVALVFCLVSDPVQASTFLSHDTETRPTSIVCPQIDEQALEEPYLLATLRPLLGDDTFKARVIHFVQSIQEMFSTNHPYLEAAFQGVANLNRPAALRSPRLDRRTPKTKTDLPLPPTVEKQLAATEHRLKSLGKGETVSILDAWAVVDEFVGYLFNKQSGALTFEILGRIGDRLRATWHAQELDDAYGQLNQYLPFANSQFQFSSDMHEAYRQLRENHQKVMGLTRGSLDGTLLSRWTQGVALTAHLRVRGPHFELTDEKPIDNELLVSVVREYIPALLAQPKQWGSRRTFFSGSEFDNVRAADRDVLLWGLAVMLDARIHNMNLAEHPTPTLGKIAWPGGPRESIREYLLGNKEFAGMLTNLFRMDARGNLTDEPLSQTAVEDLLAEVLSRSDDDWRRLDLRAPGEVISLMLEWNLATAIHAAPIATNSWKISEPVFRYALQPWQGWAARPLNFDDPVNPASDHWDAKPVNRQYDPQLHPHGYQNYRNKVFLEWKLIQGKTFARLKEKTQSWKHLNKERFAKVVRGLGALGIGGAFVKSVWSVLHEVSTIPGAASAPHPAMFLFPTGWIGHALSNPVPWLAGTALAVGLAGWILYREFKETTALSERDAPGPREMSQDLQKTPDALAPSGNPEKAALGRSAFVFMPGGFDVSPKYKVELLQHSRRASKVYEDVHNFSEPFLGLHKFDYRTLALQGTDPELSERERAVALQLGTLAHQIALWETYKSEILAEHELAAPEAILGISQGSVAAAYAAGFLDMQEAVELTVLKNQFFVSAANDQHRRRMAAVSGMTRKELQNCLRLNGETGVITVQIARDQFLVATEERFMEGLKTRVQRHGHLRESKLAGSAHDPYLLNYKGAEYQALKDYLDRLSRKTTPGHGRLLPLFSSLHTGKLLRSRQDIAQEQVELLSKPIPWDQITETLDRTGIDNFVQVGSLKPHAVEQQKRAGQIRAEAQIMNLGIIADVDGMKTLLSPTAAPHTSKVSRIIQHEFDQYYRRFFELSDRAGLWFLHQDRRGSDMDVRERNKLYREAVGRAHLELQRLARRPADLHTPVADLKLLFEEGAWDAAEREYLQSIADHPNPRQALSFFRSVKRRVLGIKGIPVPYAVDDIRRDPRYKVSSPVFTPYSVPAGHITPRLMKRILKNTRLGLTFDEHDLALAAERLDYELLQMSGLKFVKKIEIANAVFYRNNIAYVIGRIRRDSNVVPFSISLDDESLGRIDEVRTGPQDLTNLLMTSTRSPFQIAFRSYMKLVKFLSTLILPERGPAALLASLGFLQNAKADLNTELQAHLQQSGEHFVKAPGVEGLAVATFTLPDFPYVFKVARDRPPIPWDKLGNKIFHGKRAVIQIYRTVNEMDRVGHMLDPWLYQHYRIKKSLLSQEVLEDLRTTASSSLREEGDEVILDHVFIERKVTPLNIYLARERDPLELRRIENEYAVCIKNLAVAGIWVGDYNPKNFGVTQGGKVVLYDFDDLESIMQPKFRMIPRSGYDDNWSYEHDGAPFDVGEADVFPEELFAGFHGNHRDLATASYWDTTQKHWQKGEFPDTYRFNPKKRLHLWIGIEPSLAGLQDPKEAYEKVVLPVMHFVRGKPLSPDEAWVTDLLPSSEEIKHLPLSAQALAQDLDQAWQQRGWDTRMIDTDIAFLRSLGPRPRVRLQLQRWVFLMSLAWATAMTSFQTAAEAAQQVIARIPLTAAHAAFERAAAVSKASDPLRRDMRATLFEHSDGIDFITTPAALQELGILEYLRTHDVVSMADLLRDLESRTIHVNKGYLHVAMRLLADQGWITRNGNPGNDAMTFQLTDFGSVVTEPGYLQAYVQAARFLKAHFRANRQLDHFLAAKSYVAGGDPSYTQWVDAAAHNFGLPEETHPVRQQVHDRVLSHLQGTLLGPTAVAFADRGIFDLFNEKGDLQRETLAETFDPEMLDAALKLLRQFGWIQEMDGALSLTERGKVGASLAWSYGVPYSYLPMLTQVETLLTGDPTEVYRRDAAGNETHINRRINVLGSGAAHKIYFEQFKIYFKEIFDQPFEKQPQFLIDEGCGDGTFLQEFYSYILTHTYRGQLIRQDPIKYRLPILGGDINQVARLQAKKRLDAAGLPNDVIYDDINDPEGLAAALRARGFRPTWGLYTNTFLIHNAPYVDPIEPSIEDSASEGAFVSYEPRYADSGYLIPNARLEQKMLEFFKKKQRYIARFGMASIELHAVSPEVTASHTRKFPGTSYHATHFYSAQYLVEVGRYLELATRSGLMARWHKRLPENLPDGQATISLTHFTASNFSEFYSGKRLRRWWHFQRPKASMAVKHALNAAA